METLRIVEAKIGKYTFPLSPESLENNPDNYITVVIGNNATGKSRLLTNILNCLRAESNPKLRSKKYEDTNLTLSVDNHIVNIPSDNLPLFNPIHLLDRINIISISNSLFDKFPHQVSSDYNYSYIGARQQGSFGTNKKGITINLMDILSQNLGNQAFLHKANEIFSFLKLSPTILISLRELASRRSSHIIDRNSSVEELTSCLHTLANQTFYRNQQNKIYEFVNDRKFMIGFHNYLKTSYEDFVKSKSRKTLDYEINLRDISQNDEFIEDYKYFSLLRSLNMLTYNSILIRKKGDLYDINDSSTGEIGLLTTFLRAIPELKSNSIIFIDEPEISLHPSWQMKYIDLLQRFLKGYTGCHVIIATHSHLLLSDLRNEWSSVLTLRTGDKHEVVAKLQDYTPYGWSPEAILYEVFGVATVRNQLFEVELTKLLQLISHESDDIEQIQQYVQKFESFEYSDADPLNLILEEAKEYVNSKR